MKAHWMPLLILVIITLSTASCGRLPQAAPAVPTIDPILAERQLQGTIQRWTNTQRIGVDCVMAACNQHVDLSMTFVAPELIEDLAKRHFAGKRYTLEEYDAYAQNLVERMYGDGYWPFILIVAPGKQFTSLTRSEFIIGDLTTDLLMLSSHAQNATPAKVDLIFQAPLPATEGYNSRGYLFFNIEGENQTVLVDYERDTSVALQLVLPKELRSDKSRITWTIDLVAPAQADPLQPTPTPDYAATPEPLIDKEIVKSVIELLTELAR